MLTGVVSRLTAAERACEPRDLGVVAYFDGYAYGNNHKRLAPFPRRLTRSEERCWRDGFNEAVTSLRCHAVHGFAVCDGRHLTSPSPAATPSHTDTAERLGGAAGEVQA